jgi:hypothetical protein
MRSPGGRLSQYFMSALSGERSWSDSMVTTFWIIAALSRAWLPLQSGILRYCAHRLASSIMATMFASGTSAWMVMPGSRT